MAAELRLLHVLLVASFVVAPLMTVRIFLRHSRLYRAGHGVALIAAVLAIVLDVPALTGVWLAFCVFGVGLFLKASGLLRWAVPSLADLVQGIPFAFSVIAATWFFCGANDLRLLGYGEAFSYYAALHGNVLGWMFGGAIAALVRWRVRFHRVYLACLGLLLVSFLIIAFGIDGLPRVKPVGVAALTVALSIVLSAFLVGTYRVSKAAFAFGVLSLACVVLTMTLAWQNELGALTLAGVGGVRSMVSVHGVLNGLVAAPAFIAAVMMLGRATQTSSTSRSPLPRETHTHM